MVGSVYRSRYYSILLLLRSYLSLSKKRHAISNFLVPIAEVLSYILFIYLLQKILFSIKDNSFKLDVRYLIIVHSRVYISSNSLQTGTRPFQYFLVLEQIFKRYHVVDTIFEHESTIRRPRHHPVQHLSKSPLCKKFSSIPFYDEQKEKEK